MRFFFITLACATLAGPAHAQASFDCSLASTDVERAICNNPSLSALDRQMAQAYRDARAGRSKAAAGRILAEQRAWLGERNACGNDLACLAGAMERRISQLSATGRQTAGLTGLYCTDDSVMGLREAGDTLQFDFMFFSGNGHACGTPVLDARAAGSGWLAQDGDCRLSLSREGDEIVVRTDTPSACKDAYCGARAQITEFRMPLSARVRASDPFRDGVGERSC